MPYNTDQSERPRKLFKPGPGSPPPEMAGRTERMADFEEAMSTLKDCWSRGEGGTRPRILFGPRGVGKTVLMDEIKKEWGGSSDIVQATPAADLNGADVGRICSLLSSDNKFWDKFEIEGGTLGPKALAQISFSAKKQAMEKIALQHIYEECQGKPKVLIVDEAQELVEDPRSASSLLNICQDLYRRAPFLLVLAGTPDLPKKIGRLRSTFMRRSRQVSMGNLSPEASRDALRKPLLKYITSFDPEALEKIVADAGGYPFFLQVWGEQLWKPIYDNDLDELTDSLRECVEHEVRAEKDVLYDSYYNEILDPIHNDSAFAVVHAFNRKEELPREAVVRAVISAIDHTQDMRERRRLANEIIDHLCAKDVLWEPEPLRMKPGMPSFHQYIREREAEMSNDTYHDQQNVNHSPGSSDYQSPARGDGKGDAGR